LDDLEYVFARVGTADVSDDVLGVAVVHAEHLDGLLFVSNLFLEFALDILHEVDFPGAGVLTDDAGEGQSSNDKEVLVDLIEQILQVSVDAGLGVDGVLFISQQVVELDDTYGDGL